MKPQITQITRISQSFTDNFNVFDAWFESAYSV